MSVGAYLPPWSTPTCRAKSRPPAASRTRNAALARFTFAARRWRLSLLVRHHTVIPLVSLLEQIPGQPDRRVGLVAAVLEQHAVLRGPGEYPESNLSRRREDASILDGRFVVNVVGAARKLPQGSRRRLRRSGYAAVRSRAGTPSA